MSKYELIAFLATVFTIGGTVSTVARAWFGQRRVGRGDRAAAVAPAVDDRLARIEHAVDAMAIEIERISEGQRFTTRLLAERGEAPRDAGRFAAGRGPNTPVGGRL